MHRIEDTELSEIIASYGLNDLVFDAFKQVEPDTALYFFHDKNNARYCLMTSDYLDYDVKLPCDFKYNYYPDNPVKFRAIHAFSYLDNAKKKAKGYVDDNHYFTKPSTGAACMLFAIENLE